MHTHLHTHAAPAGRKATLLRRDPSKTFTQRKAFEREMKRRFRELRKVIHEAVVELDVLGLGVVKQFDPLHANALSRRQYQFKTAPEKADAFLQWVEEEMARILELHTGPAMAVSKAASNNWMTKYIDNAYKQGMNRALEERRLAGIAPQLVEYKGRRLIDAAFSSPMHSERVGLLYARAYTDLRGVTQQMAAGMARTLAQGIAEGTSPRKLAPLLERHVVPLVVKGSGKVLSGEARALMIARTETVRAHHVATVSSYRAAGLHLGKIMAEWRATPDDRVCEECAALDGKVFTLDQIEGMIPVHPNCLIDGQVWVYTVDGKKPIRDVELGEQVLTHKGRFRKVIQLHRTPKQKPAVVRLSVRADKRFEVKKLTLTENHPVLINGVWKEAREVVEGDAVQLLAGKCAHCKTPIPFATGKFCSPSCSSIYNTTRQWTKPGLKEKVSAKNRKSMLEQYADGRRDGSTITEAAHAVTRQMAKEGRCPLAREDVREIIKKVTNDPVHRWRSSRRMKHNNPSHLPGAAEQQSEYMKKRYAEFPELHPNCIMAKKGHRTWIERRMAGALRDMGLVIEEQFRIGKCFVDICIPSLHIAIECDGEYWHKDKTKDWKRQVTIEKRGWQVLRFTGSEINFELDRCKEKVARLIANHRKQWGFVSATVVKVERWTLQAPRMLWNLSVEEDESYIANGFVVHNCRCAALPAGIGEDVYGKEDFR